jgi:hypothetical protein
LKESRCMRFDGEMSDECVVGSIVYLEAL